DSLNGDKKEGSYQMTQEKVLIMAVNLPQQREDQFTSSLDELISLSATAGGTVEQIMTQKRQHIHPATYLGEGKIVEIKQAIDALDIDVVISNDELSAGQLRNLSDRFGIRLIDRSQLILYIFAQRAKTKEGQLQVELAQLESMLPSLHGQGLILSRLGGGIGTRRPGETQLETDQRYIRRKIDDIKRRLKSIVKHRDQYRKRRRLNNVFQIAIVGYTNAGKSTIFNRLTASNTLEENHLFATLDPLTRQIQLPTGFEALITDTVGFLQELPTTLIAAFRSTLEEVSEADFILHVVDASHPDIEQQQQTVLDLLKELDAHTIPSLTVYNKKDLLDDDFIPMLFPALLTNAFNDNDIVEIKTKIEDVLKENWNAYHISVDSFDGKLLHQLDQETIVTEKAFNETRNQYMIKGYMRENHPLNRLLKEQENKND